MNSISSTLHWKDDLPLIREPKQTQPGGREEAVALKSPFSIRSSDADVLSLAVGFDFFFLILQLNYSTVGFSTPTSTHLLIVNVDFNQ